MEVYQTVIPSFMGPHHPNEWVIELKNNDLWKKFHDETTEMVITKQGRCIFPHLELNIKGLDPKSHYIVSVEFHLASNFRYKYSTATGWSKSGNAEAQSTKRLFYHLTPQLGDYWMKQPVNIKRLKLTNNPQAPDGQVVLTSMHLYQPIITIYRLPDAECSLPLHKTIAPVELQFIAVTAYQNRKVTMLKIHYNDFAKGFRADGKSEKRKSLQEKVGDEEEEEGDEEEIVIDADEDDNGTVTSCTSNCSSGVDSPPIPPVIVPSFNFPQPQHSYHSDKDFRHRYTHDLNVNNQQFLHPFYNYLFPPATVPFTSLTPSPMLAYPMPLYPYAAYHPSMLSETSMSEIGNNIVQVNMTIKQEGTPEGAMIPMNLTPPKSPSEIEVKASNSLQPPEGKKTTFMIADLLGLTTNVSN